MADWIVSPVVLYTIALGSIGLLLFVVLSRLFGPHSQKNASEVLCVKEGETTPSKFRDDDPLKEFDDSPEAVTAECTTPPPLHSEDTEHILYNNRLSFSEEEMKERAEEYYELMNRRRSVRQFSPKPVPREIIEHIIHTAGTSPSGAHSEPWAFVVVEDQDLKSNIRTIVEQEEYINYDRRMGDKWVQDLQFIGTNHEKQYLEDAPYIIVVFKQPYSIASTGHKQPHYYYEISTAIACGLLVSAIHYAGLVTVTTTPMNAGGQIRQLLGRPENEKVMLLLPVGYPIDEVVVPGVERKPLSEILVWK